MLHDWDDSSSREILKKCRDSLGENGRLIVVEALVPEHNGPHFIKDLDVYMMALFPVRERAVSEFKKLFYSARLKFEPVKGTAESAESKTSLAMQADFKLSSC